MADQVTVNQLRRKLLMFRLALLEERDQDAREIAQQAWSHFRESTTAPPSDLTCFLTQEQMDALRYIGPIQASIQHGLQALTRGEVLRLVEDALGERPFLGCAVNMTDLTVTRNGITAKFQGKHFAWRLFTRLFYSEDEGWERRRLQEYIWGNETTSDNNLDQQKRIANSVLQPLRIEIDADKGVWKLKSF